MILVAWLLAQAAVPAVPASQLKPATTLQAQFEQATAALLAKQWDAALTDFRAIEARPQLSQRTRSIVAMREGQALDRLERPEAADTIRKGLSLAASDDVTLRDDRLSSYLTLGGIEHGDFDYIAARHDFEAALALSDDPISQLATLMSLANVTMFDDDGAALGYVDQALQLTLTHKVDATIDGRLHDLRGRVLMNHGDFAGALIDFNVALKDFGGLTTKTDMDDVAVRSDLTLAYLLTKNSTKARDYLGMTGEGRAPDNAMLHGPADADLPTCGGDIKPDDAVVVEFGIGGDGNVLYARPVYVSRPGPVALEFARAVYGWSWAPKELKQVPEFYRIAARLELRCSTAPDRPSPIALLRSDVDAWQVARHLTPMSEDKDVHAIARLKAKLADRDKAGPDDIGVIPLLIAVAQSPATSYEDSRAFYVRAGAIAAADHAPAAVLTYFAVRGAMPLSGKRREIEAYNAVLARLLNTPSVVDDARSAATVRLMLAQSRRSRDPVTAAVYLDAIVADHRLDARDPLRVGALLQLASIKAQQSDLAAAQRFYQQTGLDDQQCALVDAEPVRVSGRTVGEEDYPQEARDWGISGWAKTEFDIKADGSPDHVRTVMAYPPFIFGRPIERVVSHMKYTQTYRPQGGLGCGGESYQEGFHYVSG
jgi:tetratricopeptide (TPR) repeat protein